MDSHARVVAVEERSWRLDADGELTSKALQRLNATDPVAAATVFYGYARL